MINTWILPILIGIVSAILLLTILYNDPKIKQAFSDLGALIQLQTSRPVYYHIGLIPGNLPYSPGNNIYLHEPLTNSHSNNNYNMYPITPLNPTPGFYSTNTSNNQINIDNDKMPYNPHKRFYWELSNFQFF